MPLCPGMRISSSRQSAVPARSELKYSSAEANVFTAKPTDLSSRLRPSRTDRSSSTIEIRRGIATSETANDGATIQYTFVYSVVRQLRPRRPRPRIRARGVMEYWSTALCQNCSRDRRAGMHFGNGELEFATYRFFARQIRNLSCILTRSAKEPAPILCIT